MNHPSNEEWGLYVFGEAPPELQRKLKTHLGECEQCAADVAAMQGTLHKLDAWQIPSTPRRVHQLEPMLKFAMAAAIVLAIGVGLGRFSAPKSPDVALLKTELMAQVDSALAQNAAFSSNLLAAAEIRLAQQTDLALQSFGREILETVNVAREQDRAAVQNVIDQIKRQRETDYVSLRRDLETVAAATDQGLRRAQASLLEIAANANPTQPQ
jgi:hypothetical protein